MKAQKNRSIHEHSIWKRGSYLHERSGTAAIPFNISARWATGISVAIRTWLMVRTASHDSQIISLPRSCQAYRRSPSKKAEKGALKHILAIGSMPSQASRGNLRSSGRTTDISPGCGNISFHAAYCGSYHIQIPLPGLPNIEMVASSTSGTKKLPVPKARFTSL